MTTLEGWFVVGLLVLGLFAVAWLMEALWGN